jgi:hypothetical protein
MDVRENYAADTVVKRAPHRLKTLTVDFHVIIEIAKREEPPQVRASPGAGKLRQIADRPEVLYPAPIHLAISFLISPRLYS